MSEGASFITINPATLDDTALWSYQDLRSLCKRVKIKGNGKREELVKRLQAWNRLRLSKGVAGLSELAGSPNDKKNWLSMNVEGANFALLGQNVVARANSPAVPADGSENETPTADFHSPNQVKGSRRRSSISPRPARGSTSKNMPAAPSSTQKKKAFNFDIDSNTMAVSPTLLKPLNMLPGERDQHEVTTPGKSILKVHGGSEQVLPGSASKISFSPFNGTKVIPHRRAPNTTGKQFWQEEDDGALLEDSREEDDYEEEEDDENNPDLKDLDENYVDAEAARNAEQNANIGADGEAEDDESSGGSAQELWERAF